MSLMDNFNDSDSSSGYGIDEEPDDAYECSLEAHALAVILPNDEIRDMVLNAPPGVTVEWVKNRIIELHCKPTQYEGPEVVPAEHKIVLTNFLLGGDQTTQTLDETRSFASYSQDMLHFSEIRVMTNEAVPADLASQYPPMVIKK